MSRVWERLRSSQHRANLRAWGTFRRACGNELAVDVELMRVLKFDGLFPDVLPRPIALSRKLARVRPLWRSLLLIAAALWSAVLFPMLLVVQIARTLQHLRKVTPCTQPLAGEVAVVLTARICEVLRCVPKERQPRQFLTTPWQAAPLTPDDGVVTSLLSYVTRRDLGRSAWLAWRAVRIVRRKGLGSFPGGRSRTAILQTYIAWEWFLTWCVLPRAVSSTSSLWFANHYDRWAVLLDRLPVSGQRRLVQHGFARGELRLPYRQRHVSEVLYFDRNTRQILQDVALRSTCAPRWTPLRAQLALTPPEAQGWRSLGFDGTRPSVLIIGQPLDPDCERELLTELAAACPEATLIYKAHPLYGKSGTSHVPVPPVQILWDRTLFPAADVVLCGLSWLGVEYESTGVPVVWYKSRPLAEVIAQVRAELTRSVPPSSRAA